jgi:hypothetical protein
METKDCSQIRDLLVYIYTTEQRFARVNSQKIRCYSKGQIYWSVLHTTN